LENVDNQLIISRFDVSGSDFNATVLKGPNKFSLLMELVSVVSLKFYLTIVKLLRDLADNWLFHRPLSIGEDFSVKLYSLDHVAAVAVLDEFSLGVLAGFDVLEHVSHFTDSVDAALNFEFGYHLLLSFDRDQTFV